MAGRGRPKKIITETPVETSGSVAPTPMVEEVYVAPTILTYKDGNRIYNLGEIVMLLATECSIYELKFDKLHLINIKETSFGKVTALLREGKLFRRL